MLRSIACSMGLVALAATLGGCPDEPRRPIGAACEDNAMCKSGVCGEGLCLEAGSDTDGDSLSNELEVRLGSNPVETDTDGDGIPDGAEFNRTDLTNLDTDGDGLADIVESATLDPDGDCIPDQYDAQNTVPNSDLSPMIDVVCSTQGICAGQRATFGVACPAGVAVCLYTNVPGYANPETACDGIDQDCDGVADDGFPDRDKDHVADCVDTDWDNDGVSDKADDCPTVANQDQADADHDGIGDACVAEYRLRFGDQPPDAVSGVALTSPVSVSLESVAAPADAPPVPTFTGQVTLSIDAAQGVTLSGTTAAQAVLGIATFGDLIVSGAGEGIVLRATSGELGPAASDPFDVTPSGPGRIAIEGLAAGTVAGAQAGFDVVVYDGLDRVATEFAGTVTFASSDLAATLPAPTTLSAADAGRKHVAATFLSAGTQTLDATTDAATGALTTRASVAVHNAFATSLAVVPAAESVTSGLPFAVVVTARDAYGNAAVDYAGTVTLSASDAAATLPTAYAFAGVDAGVHAFDGVVLAASGAQTIEANDAGGLHGEAGVTVRPSGAALLALVSAPTTIVAGVPFEIVVELRDARGNPVEDSASTLGIATSDPRIAARNVSTSAARTTVTVTLESAGAQTVTLTDGTTGLFCGATVGVTPGAMSALALASSDGTVGVQALWTLRALDAFGNVAAGFVGDVVVVSSDARATFPATVTFAAADLGVQSVPYRAATAGVATVTVASGAVSISVHPSFEPGPAQSLTLTAPSSATAGDAVAAEVTVLDAFGNRATGYRGTVTLTATDTAAVLPGAHVFDAADAGRATFAGVVLKTAGAVTLTAADSTEGSLRANANVAVSARAASTLEVVLGDSAVPAGVTTHAVVTARDTFGNVDTAYLGTIFATSTDPLATLPGDATFGAADHGQVILNGLVFRTLGEQTLTVTDRANAALTGLDSLSVDEGADVVLRFEDLPASATAGASFDLALVAEDLFGNRVSDYLGTVHLQSDEATSPLAEDHVFTAGDGGRFVFAGVTLHQAGNVTVRATDSADARIQTSGLVQVRAAPAARLVITPASPTTVAGASVTVFVAARDAFDNLVTDYVRLVNLTVDDPHATTPGAVSFTLADGGRHAFDIILRTAGMRALRAVDGVVPDATGSIDVTPADPTQLGLDNLPPTVVAAVPTLVRLTVRDAFDNTVPTFTGSAAVTSTDPRAEFTTPVVFAPANAGTVEFPVTFHSAGDRVLTANAGGALVASGSTRVDPGAPASLVVTGLPATVVAGDVQGLTATVRDADGNTATGFIGTAAVSVTNTQATYPSSLAFGAGDLGVRVFSVTLGTAGASTVTVDAGGNLRGTAATTVIAASGASFTLSNLPAQVTAGTAQSLEIVVSDTFGNVATGYAGTFALTISDPSGTGPASVSLAPADAGRKSFSVTLRTAGNQSVTAASAQLGTHATSTLVGASGAASIDVSALPASVTAGTSTALTLTLRDVFGNVATTYAGTVNIASTDTAATFPGTVVFTGSEAGTQNFNVILKTAGTRTMAVSTQVGGLTDNTSTTVTPAAASVIAFAAVPSNATAGTAFGATVRLDDPYGNQASDYRGVVSFTSSDAGATLPTSYTFTAADAGSHVFSGAFTLKKSGPQTLVATGTALTTSQVTATLQVASGAAASLHFVPVGGAVTAGVAFDETIEVRDANGNVATGYTGKVHFTSGDTGAKLPADYTFVAGDQGTHTFPGGFTLVTVGLGTITASDSAAGAPTPGSAGRTVGPAAAHHADLSLTPGNGTAGTPFSATVTMRDLYNNLATGYGGTITFAVNDPSATLPSARTFVAGDNGSVSFPAGLTLRKAQLATVSVTGTGLGINPVTANKTIVAGPASSLGVVATPATNSAGVKFTVAVTVLDAFDNPTGSGSQTVSLTSATSACTPMNLGLANGAVSTPDFVCTIAGLATIHAATQPAGLSGDRNVTITPGPIARLAVDPLAPPYTVGAPISPPLRVRATDVFGNPSPESATIAFDLYYNGTRGRLGGTKSRTVAGATASFGDLTIDQPGTYGLRASLTSASGTPPVLLPKVLFQHAAPAVAIGPIGASRGCTVVDFVLTQAASAPVDVTMTYHVGANTADATLDGKAAPGGTLRLTTSPTGVTHTLVWHNGVDLPRQDVTGVTLTIVARTSDGKLGSGTSAAFDVQNAWDPAYLTTAIPSGFKSGGAAVADLDHNGHDDVLVVDQDSSTFRVFFGRTTGGFASQSFSYNAGQYTPHVGSVALLDVNADGNLDVVLGDTQNNRLYALQTSVTPGLPGDPPVVSFTQYNDGSLQPCWRQEFTPYITTLATTDEDRDGIAEVIVGCGAGHVEIASLSLDGPGIYYSERQNIQLANQEMPISAVAGDFVGDGTRAVLVGAMNSGSETVGATVYVYWDGIWLANAQFGDSRATAVTAGDYDMDGLLDVAVLDDTRHLDLFWGNTAFSTDHRFDLAAYVSSSDALVAADIDHDGRTEMAIGSIADDSVVVLASTDWVTSPALRATTVDTGTAVSGGPRGLAVRDFDRDGRNDLAVVRADNGPTAALGFIRGSAEARCGLAFDAPAGAPLSDVDAVDAVLADVDHDGKLDAAFLEADARSGNLPTAPGVVIAYGDGGGGFAASTPVSIDTVRPVVEAAFADVTGDGDLDLIVLTNDAPGEPGGEIHVFEQASPADWTELATAFGPASAGLIADDIDLDGDIDIAFSETNQLGTNATFHIFLQGANHAFTEAATVTAGGRVTAVAAADLSFDGVLDFALKRTSLLQGNNDVCLVRSNGVSWPANLTSAPCRNLSGAATDLFALRDISGDGLPELVAHSQLTVGIEGTIPLVIFQLTSDGTAQFDPKVGNPETYDLCNGLGRVAFGDLDGDQAEELIATCGVGLGSLHVFFQASAGPRYSDNDFVAFGVESFSASEWAVGQFDGHGLDLLHDGTVFHLTEAGSLSDDPPHLTVVATEGVTAIHRWVVADFNRDGFADFAATDDSHGDTFDAAYSDGAPDAFMLGATYVPGLESTLDLIGAGDLSADGRDDLVLTTGYGNTSQLILELWEPQNPLGFSYDSGYHFTLPATPTALAFGPLSYEVPGFRAEADPRSKAMIALATGGTAQVAVLRRLPYSGYDLVTANWAADYDFPDEIDGLASGRFSADPADTIAVVGMCSAPVPGPCVVLARLGYCLQLDGMDCVMTESWLGIAGYEDDYVTATAFGDLNHDGLTDIVVGLTQTAANGGNSEVVVLRGNPDDPGTFVLDAVGLQGKPAIDWIGLADVDLDGRVDLVATRRPELFGACRVPEIALQQPSAAALTFAPRQATISDGACAVGATVFDYNRDGHPDVMTVDALGALRPLVQR